MFRKFFGIVWMGAAALAAAAPTTAVFPVQYSLSDRYLVDQNATPFPIMGRTAWFITSLSVVDYHTFIDDSVLRGYNSIELHVVNHDPRGNNPPFCGSGDLPFIKRLDGINWNGSLTYGNINNEAPDFTTPNEPYWSFVDGLLSYCESKGILVFMFPSYVGFAGAGSNQGWIQEMVANGPAKIQTYGSWIATRYQGRKNLVWMMGGDMGTFNPAQNAAEAALLAGLKSVNGQQSTYFSAEWESGMIATDQLNFGAAMTLNGAYSFSGDVNNLGRRAYSRALVEPAFLLEEPYDEEGADGNGANPNAIQPVRRFQWWGWLSSIGGYISGNGYVWPFRSPDWLNHLNTQGSRDMMRLNAFINSIRWFKLVPSGLSGIRTLVTNGGSTPSLSDYVAAAGTSDGTLLVAYIPPAHSGSITVDMTAMSGPSKADWYDPTNATDTEIGTGLPNTGTRVFTPPGNNGAGDGDWVLVIERLQAPDTEPPVVTLTAPIGGATVSSTITVSATATDNVGVMGVRLQVDGTDLVPEIVTSPYTVSWNTQLVGNGPHVVRAIARDLANNNVSSSASVTVNNVVVNPLVAAYGFNEGAGATVGDLSGYGNTGTITGASWTSQGHFGNALNFNGTSNWITVNDSNSLDISGAMTLEAWAYPSISPGIWTTFALKEAPPGAFAYLLQADPSSRPSSYITTDADGSQGVTATQPLPVNTWSFVAATYNGTVLSLYVNGVPAGNTFVSGNILPSAGPLRFGGNSIWGEYFAGAIDEVRLYNRALSLSEIQTDMNTAVGAQSPTPTPAGTPSPTPGGVVSIAGAVSYCTSPTAHPVAGVTLTLSGSGTGTVVTDATGNYQFVALISGGSYSVTPSKPAVLPGGTGAKINTIDMVAVQRHFLQITPLTGCRLTAGDVTGEGVANTVDIIAIQRFYLGGTTGIANTGKYRFIPVNRSYPGISSSQNAQDYDTLVLGDVATPFIE
jgi:hypothetical protein